MSPQLTVPADRPSDHFFSKIPPQAAESLTSGFSQLHGLTPDQLEALVSYVIAWLDPSELLPDMGVLATTCQAEPSEMTAMAAAATFQASAMFTAKPPMQPRTFVEKATHAGVLPTDHASTIADFGANHLEPSRDAFQAAFARGRSSIQVIPCFTGLSATIDLRIVDLGRNRFVTLPTAVALLTTDVDDEKLVFQMTRRDVKQLMDRLKSLDEQLALAKDTRTEAG